MARRLVAIAALLIMTGCSGAPPEESPEPVPTPAPDRPISLRVSPDFGTPGADVTATLRLQHPERIRRRESDGSFRGWICFQECGAGGTSMTITFTPSPSDEGMFTAAFTVPVVLRLSEPSLRFDPLAAGEYQVQAACVLDQASGCASRAEVSTTFRVAQGLETAAWQQSPATGAAPVEPLGAMSTTSHSPLPGSQRTVECVAGNLAPQSGEPAPRLLRTDEAGRPQPPITFAKGGPLFGRHDYASCEAVALDPTNPESYYILEAPHAGGTEPGAYPWPQFTRDGGANWAPVPAPAGFEARKTFAGFSVTADGVTAWFSRASLEARTIAADQIRGSFTRDGGNSWTTIEPSCPDVAPACLWQLRDRPPALHSGLIRSVDGGKSWSRAALNAMPFSADQVYVLDGADGQTLEAVGAASALHGGFMPLLRSEDRGATWRWVEVPTPPGGWMENAGAAPAIRLDRDGALLVGKKNGGNPTRWYRLARGSTKWQELDSED